jgi:hypothetical protein
MYGESKHASLNISQQEDQYNFVQSTTKSGNKMLVTH